MSSLAVDHALSLDPGSLANALLRLPEDQWFERKSGRVKPKDIAIPLAAMANAEGGVIVAGLHDGVVEGVEPARINDLRQAAIDFTTPPVRVDVREYAARRDDASEATLLVLRVEVGERVHLLTDGTCYLRVGDESRRLTAPQQQELAFDRGGPPYDSTPVDLGIEDLDQDQLRSYAGAIGSASIEGMLAARDLVDRRGRPNVAACLLFDARPQREFPSAYVRVLRYGTNERGTGSSMSLEDGGDVRLEGSIPQQITATSSVIEQLMPKWQQLGASGLFEATPRIPRDVWLEGVVNAVVHRSYSMMGDHIRVEIFPNRIEITSPGRFPGLVDPAKPLEISRYARNPRIARVCADLGITRELGEGIARMFDEMRRRGLTDPIYRQFSGAVRLTLSAADAVPQEILRSLPASARNVLDALRVAGEPLGTGALAELAGIARPTATRALAALQDHGLVVWSGNSRKDPRAVWALL